MQQVKHEPISGTPTLPASTSCPWRRYLARRLDHLLYTLLVLYLCSRSSLVNLTQLSSIGFLLFGFAGLLVMLLVEPIWLHLWGTTPGKALLGLHIKTAEGRTLSYTEALTRTSGTLGGMGFYVPLVELFCLWSCYKRCTAQEPQPWEEPWQVYTAKPLRFYHTLCYLLGCAALLFVLSVAYVEQQRPPHRGALTVAEFAENYRYYADYYGYSLHNHRLNDEGLWEELPTVTIPSSSGTTIFLDSILDTLLPLSPLDIEEVDGTVQSVSFSLEWNGTADSLQSTYAEEMFLASLALTSAQSEVGLFDDLPYHLSTLLLENKEESLHYEGFGVSIQSTIDSEDFFPYSADRLGLLFPRTQGTQERHFAVQFRIHRLDASAAPLASPNTSE